jgi:hypothetical protein
MKPTAAFKTEQEARDHCEQRNAEGGAGSWISWELKSGEWGVVHTTLPSNVVPTGSTTETKPEPPTPGNASLPLVRREWGAG